MRANDQLVPLGDVVKPIRPRVKPTENPDLPFIGMEHVEAHTMKLLGTVPASEMKSASVRFQPGDVLYGRLRPYLNKVVRPTFGGLCSAEFIVFPENDRVDGKYLQYFLNSSAFVNFATHLNAGDRPRVDFDQIAAFEIPLRTIDEQHRIVAEIEKQFSRLDQAVASLRRVKAQLKRYKASVLKAAVEGRLVETEAQRARREGRGFETGAELAAQGSANAAGGRKPGAALHYETGEQLLKRILETRRSQWKGKGKYKEPAAPETVGLPELPEGWVWARLESIAALKGGITVDSKRQDPTARAVPYLRVANVQRGYLDLSEVKTINAPAADIEELRLQQGDILFNEGGDRDKLGRGWIWEGQLPDCIHQNHVFRARLASSDILPKLMSWWGNSFGKDYFQREGKQTTNLASINLTKLRGFPVPLPPLAEQHRIVAEVDRRLSIVREVEAEVNANLKRAQALRQAVLARAFTGASS